MVDWVVGHQIRMRMWLPESDSIGTRWGYRPADPWAIQVLFADGGYEVPWTFARQLLAQGVDQPAGLGDVQIYPYRGAIAVAVHGPGGSAMFTARRADLARFLAATYWCVPAGRESAVVDVDRALVRLAEEADQC